jgi:hypothetical protein
MDKTRRIKPLAILDLVRKCLIESDLDIRIRIEIEMESGMEM